MSTGDPRGQDDDLELPDNIIGIGNAGKTVVTHYLSQDWIIDRAVGGPEPNEDEFSAFIIDTATNEQSTDERDVERINQKIEETAESFGKNPDLIDTGIDYINPLDDASDQFISRTGLTSKATVQTIARNDNLTAWWLENNSDMLTDGYGQGVLRRRGLSKALYHASRAAKGSTKVNLNDLSRNLTSGKSDDGTATMVVGLGGGTGSGTYLDLAKHLSEEVTELNLIASVPGLDEKNRRTANCFAALSELEYLALNGENPFTNIVLLPFGPAKQLSNKETFLDAFVQTIIARESTTNDFTEFLDEASAQPIPKKFAPFTVAVPQILRYDVGDIREQEQAIEEYRETKREALDAEISLYEAIHDYFTDEWDGEVGDLLVEVQRNNAVGNDQFALSGSEASSLRNRLDDLRSWIEDEERFGSVNNEALVTWREQLGQWIDREQEQNSDRPQEEIKKQLVTRVPERIESLRPVEDVYASEPSERKLAGVIRDELRTIKLRANLLRALKVIDEEEVREAVDSAIDPDADGYIGSRRLEDRVNSLNRDIDTHESNLEVLDDLETDLEDARDYVIESWHDAVADDLELLVELDSNADEVRERLRTLNEEFEGQLRTISQANTPDNVRAGGLDFNFDRLNAQLRDIGVDPIDGQQISDSIEQTKRAYEVWDDINNGGGILGKIGFGDRQEKENEYVAYVDAVDERYVEITPSGERGDFEQDFSCTPATDGLFEDVISEIEEKRQRIRHRIVQEFKTTISEFEGTDAVSDRRAQWTDNGFDLEWPGDTGDAVPTLRDRLENLDAESADAVLDDLTADGTGYEDPGTVYVAFTDAYLAPIEAKRSELHDEIEEKRRRAEVYKSLRDAVVQYDDAFDGMGPSRPEVDDAQRIDVGSDTDSPYVTKVEADDQLSLLQYEDIADSGVWTDRSMENEKYKIGRFFEKRFAENAITDTNLNCLANRLIETQNTSGEYTNVTSTRYDGHYVGNIYMSRAFPDQEDPGDDIFQSVENVFRASDLHLRDGGDGYTHESKSYGAPWDLSMITFVGGIFLDNLYPVIQPTDGYLSSYEAQREELAESVRIRHVHGVDGRDDSISAPGEGGYVYRDAMLDLDDPEDLYRLIDGNETEVVDMLLDEYVETTTFGSSIDLDDDA
jgi:hypothetical protein